MYDKHSTLTSRYEITHDKSTCRKNQSLPYRLELLNTLTASLQNRKIFPSTRRGWQPVMLEDEILVTELSLTRQQIWSNDLRNSPLALNELDGYSKNPTRSISWSCQAPAPKWLSQPYSLNCFWGKQVPKPILFWRWCLRISCTKIAILEMI